MTEQNTACTLDHVGIAGADLAPLASAYQRLGFTLTPRARHSGRQTPEGPIVPFGTGNRCVMLHAGYLELIAILDPSAFADGLAADLARYEGIHILALGMIDEGANLARLRSAGVVIPGIAYLERPVDDSDPRAPIARFARLPLPDAPEGHIFLIRHLTPEVLRPERALSHPNHAVALVEVVLASHTPAETARRLSALAGIPVTPDPVGGFRLTLARGCVRMLPVEAIDAVFPGIKVPPPPCIVGATIETDDANAALRAILGKAEVPHQVLAFGVLVAPEAAGGAALMFRTR